MQVSEAPILEVEKAYVEFRPVLLRALGALARRGFLIDVRDGIDFVHDFFIERWPAVCSNFNPVKGKFEAYVYGSFVHFARPRIVRLRRLQDSLVPPEALELLECTNQNLEDIISTQLDMNFLLVSINDLPRHQRHILTAYLYSSGRSERSLAKRFALSRYRVRETLVEALGRVITGFPKSVDMSGQDWEIARLVWGQNRTLQETAMLLEISVQQVRNSMSRISHSIAEIMKRFHSDSGEIVMPKPQGAPNSDADLLQRVLNSPGDEALLQELRVYASEILTVIDSASFSIAGTMAEENNPLWLARVYEALSNDIEDIVTPEQLHLERVLFYTEEADLISIGRAFAETLLPDLPYELTAFTTYFASVPEITAKEMQLIIKDRDVEAAFPISTDLAIFGIRPVTIFYAAEAIAALLDRLLRYELIQKENLILSVKSSIHLSLRDEIAQFAECPKETADALFRWLLDIAEYKPFIFIGFEAELNRNGVLLRRTAQTFGSLYERWGASRRHTMISPITAGAHQSQKHTVS